VMASSVCKYKNKIKKSSMMEQSPTQNSARIADVIRSGK
jgi:hypothetical protein